MDQLLCHLKNGYFQSPSDASSGHRILRINAVRPLSVDLGEVRFLPELSGDASSCYVRDGDLLFTRYNGSGDLLGVAGMVRGCSEPTLHPDKLICVRTVLPQPHPAYLEIAANTGLSRSHMVSRARTTAGQTGISGLDVREIPVPLPPLDEQEQIVSEVEARLSVASATERQLEANLARAARLRQAILKRAFAGALVPQDPADEPATALLTRLRAEETQPTVSTRRRSSREKNAAT